MQNKDAEYRCRKQHVVPVYFPCYVLLELPRMNILFSLLRFVGAPPPEYFIGAPPPEYFIRAPPPEYFISLLRFIGAPPPEYLSSLA